MSILLASRASPQNPSPPVTALELGYRMIDCAQIYKNERAVGDALAKSGIDREEVFITSKVWRSNHGYEKTYASCMQSLRDLQSSYIDLMLIHYPDCKRGWPLRWGETNPASWTPAMRNNETWRALEDLVFAGKLKHIGVSNYSKRHLQELLASCRIKPFLNQIELHPCLQQRELTAYCDDSGILLQAFASLGGGDRGAPLLQNPKIMMVAKEANKTSAQVLLKWALQKGYSVLPKSIEKSRLASNLELDFQLSCDHMNILDGMDKGLRLTWKGVDPDSIA